MTFSFSRLLDRIGAVGQFALMIALPLAAVFTLTHVVS